MPSEKQIEALQEFAKWAIRESVFQAASIDGLDVQEKALSLGLLEQTVFDPEIHGYSPDAEKGDWWFVFSSLLTAAEQAESAPPPDDSLSAVISSIGNEIHNLACERQNDEDLSERLSDFRDRLWAIAQQAPIEPAPVARSGAVKVVEDTYERYPKIMDRLAALEPAEPAPAAEACVERGSEKSTPQPESRLREALESIANNTCCSGCQEAALVARAALAQEDGR